MTEIAARNTEEARNLAIEAGISAGSIYHLADMLYDISLGLADSGREAGALAVAIKESAKGIERRAEAVCGFIEKGLPVATQCEGGASHQ
ncbi:MAG: hypothetical protein JNM61_08790 [Zoogloeaceae bacterium]|nr:hypothetical protein [Zoogloeaceae bacterium]